MFTLIKNGEVYSPAYLGRKDIFVAGGKVAAVGENLEVKLPCEVEVVNAHGKLIMPGFIDQHVHITGGGGEGGFTTRTREIDAADLFLNGITTVAGVLGTDGVTRSLEALYAKAKALEEEGLSTYIYSGSYQVPTVTFTGSIQKDIILIDKVVGAGEIAISDHRSFQPTVNELARIAAEARVGGMLSGKAGMVHLHLGDAEQGLDMVFEIINTTPIPVTQFIPTHINRNKKLLARSVEFALRGGIVDLTAGFECEDELDDCVPSYLAYKSLIEQGVSEDNITISSDGNGSKPVFDKNGRLTGIEAASCSVLYQDIRKAVMDLKLPLERVLKTVTKNPAKVLKLEASKGSIAVNKDGDLVIADAEMNIEAVYAKGVKVADNGKYFSSKGR